MYCVRDRTIRVGSPLATSLRVGCRRLQSGTSYLVQPLEGLGNCRGLLASRPSGPEDLRLRPAYDARITSHACCGREGVDNSPMGAQWARELSDTPTSPRPPRTSHGHAWPPKKLKGCGPGHRSDGVDNLAENPCRRPRVAVPISLFTAQNSARTRCGSRCGGAPSCRADER